MDERAAPTGPFVLPRATTLLDWDAQAFATLTLLGANHVAGLYSVSGLLVVRTAPAAGIAFREIRWNAPGAPGQVNSSPGPISLSVPGTVSSDPVEIFSDGSAAIVLEFQPAGVVPPAVVDVYGAATKVARN
jgi:hypothetical protein